MQAKSRDNGHSNLTVNTPGDIYEQEADRVAEQVTRIQQPQLRRTCACGGLCPKCQSGHPGHSHEHLQTKHGRADNPGPIATSPVVHEVLAAPGRPLDSAARDYLEPRFGHDFSRVRVHTDPKAAESARAVNALAFTVGRDVVFDAGQYAPDTTRGRRLLAHELTHVLQQDAGGEGMVQRQTPGPPDELPLPPRCSIVFDGDRFGPKLKCEGLPGIGSTPPIPLDPRQIPDYVKDKLKDALPKTNPPASGQPGGGGTPPTTTPTEIVVPPEIGIKFCQDFPALCKPQPKPTLGPLVPYLRFRAKFRQDRPQAGQSLADSLEGGRGPIDDAISAMKSDVLVTALLIGNASSEGPPDRNQGLSDRRVELIYQEFDAANVSWRVFDPDVNFEDVTDCVRLGFGRWSCGQAKADQKKPSRLIAM